MTELDRLVIEKQKVEDIMVKLDGMVTLFAGLTLGETLKVIHTVNMYQGNLAARMEELVADRDRNKPIEEADNGR